MLGIHRFYLGKIGSGILMIFTLGGAGFWWIYDTICAGVGVMKDNDGLTVRKW
jgi:TM2 domain-containing membrane protein YozV